MENNKDMEIVGDGTGEALEEVTSSEIPSIIGDCCVNMEEIDCSYIPVDDTSNDIGRGMTEPFIYMDPDDITTELALNNVNDSVFENAVVAQTEGSPDSIMNYTQDGLPTIMQNIISRYVFIRDTYKFTLPESNNDIKGLTVSTTMNIEAVVEFSTKLVPLLEENIKLNNMFVKESIVDLSETITNFIAEIKEFDAGVYSNLFDIILDNVLPDMNNTIISYKEQYKYQMRTLVIPNMVEDVMIYFNSPKDNIDDIIDFIATDCPVAEKYKVVKQDDNKFIVLLFGSENGVATYIPAYYVLTKLECEESDPTCSYNVVSQETTIDEIQGLLNMYADSSRWKI